MKKVYFHDSSFNGDLPFSIIGSISVSNNTKRTNPNSSTRASSDTTVFSKKVIPRLRCRKNCFSSKYSVIPSTAPYNMPRMIPIITLGHSSGGRGSGRLACTELYIKYSNTASITFASTQKNICLDTPFQTGKRVAKRRARWV